MQTQPAGAPLAAAKTDTYTPPKPMKRWAPALLLTAAIMQACHGCEHIAQVLQAHVFHVWPDNGILGSSLTANEWTHFSFNWAFEIAFCVSVWAYGPEARAAWKKASPKVYALIPILIVEELWHCSEHVIRIVQWFENGHPPEPGFLGQWLNLVWLHAGYNVFAMTLVLIIVTKFKVDAQVKILNAHRRRSGTEPITASRGAQMWGGTALLLCPAFMILSDTVGPTPVHNAAEEVHRAVLAHVPFAFSSFFGMLAFGFMLAGLPVLRRLAGERAPLATVGAALTAWGALCLVAIMGVLLYAAEAAAEIARGQSGTAPMVHLSERFMTPHGFMMILDSGLPLLAIGLPLLAAALFIRGAIPVWIAIAMSVGIIAQIVGHYRFDPAIYTAGNYILGVGLASIGVQVLKSLPERAARTAAAGMPAAATVSALAHDGVPSVA